MGSTGLAPFFLNSALDEAEFSALRPGRFTLEERAIGTNLTF